MNKRVVKQVCQFLRTQKDNEAFFATFWDKTKDFYPEDQSKTKVKQWLKENPEYFEIIAGKDGNPFGKIRLKITGNEDTRPSTTKEEDRQIISKLIESIDNQEGVGLYSKICSQKSELFPSQLQDKKHIRKWFDDHSDCFEVSFDVNGGPYSVQVTAKARKSRTKTSAYQQEGRRKKKQDQHDHVEEFCQYPIFSGRASSEANSRSTKSRQPRQHEDSDPTGRLINFICENGGIVTFAAILKQAQKIIHASIDNNETLFIWLSSNDSYFEILPNPNGTPYGQVKVKLNIKTRFCHSYVSEKKCTRENCPYLHICKAFLCGREHKQNMCRQSHNIRDKHNIDIVNQSVVLRKCTDQVVNKVLLKSCFPRVCLEYNKEGTCPRGDKCNFLHTCGDFVLNQCNGCTLSHNVIDGLHNIELLKKYNLLPSQKLPIEMVKTNIAYVQPQNPTVSTKPLEMDNPNLDMKKKQRTPQKKGLDKVRIRPLLGNANSDHVDSVFSTSNSVFVPNATDGKVHLLPGKNQVYASLLSSENIDSSRLNSLLTAEQKVGCWMSSGSGAYTLQDTHVPRRHSESLSSSDESVQSSVVSSQDSFQLGELEKKIFTALMDKYGGSASFQKISQDTDLFPAYFDVRKWFEDHPNSFILQSNGRGEIESVQAFSRKCRICVNYSIKKSCYKKDCLYLHICRDWVEGHCPDGAGCKLSHNFNNKQTKQLVKRFHLADFNGDQLHKLVRLSTPKICCFHNKGYCNRGINCPNVHVCMKFASRGCPSSESCSLGHMEALETEHAKKILEQYQMAKQKPTYIRKMLLIFGERPSRKTTTKPKTKDAGSGTPSKGQEDDAEICFKFLSGQSHSKKCKDVHHSMPYLWQFKVKAKSGPSTKWENFVENDCENIEKMFCDVNFTATELNIATKITKQFSISHSCYRVDFQSMCGTSQPSSGNGSIEFDIRRLESSSKNITGNGDWFESQWMWYNLSNDEWVRCEANMISVLEENYMDGKIQISSSLRRRPAKFVSRSDVQEIKRRASLEATPSQLPIAEKTDVPGPTPETPVKTNQPLAFTSPDDEHYCVKVERGTQEYQTTEKLLRGSIGQVDLEINKLEKINNKNLWSKYISKKKKMTDDLLPGETVNERHLFMPCRYDDVGRIMKDNVHVSRLDLPNVLGPGHYFTSSASLCLDRCTESPTHSRFLMVCQVLVGAYTQGSPSISEYPRRQDGRFYNSLVNDLTDPVVFVVSDVDQCYPAFIVDYSYTPASSSEQDGSLRNAEVRKADSVSVTQPPQASLSSSSVSSYSYSSEPFQQRPFMQVSGGHPVSHPSMASQQPTSASVPRYPVGYPYRDVTVPPVDPHASMSIAGEGVNSPPPYSERQTSSVNVLPSQPSPNNHPLLNPAIVGQPLSSGSVTGLPTTSGSYPIGGVPQSPPVYPHGPQNEAVDFVKAPPPYSERPPTSNSAFPSQPQTRYTGNPQPAAGQAHIRSTRQGPDQAAGGLYRQESDKKDKDCVVM